jgi:L-ascorbate metabolism protein UlaG (beta-lactamase superfamily)
VTAGSVQVTWVGHATVAIEVDGFRALTDPLLTRRVAHLRRRRPLPDADLADADAVLVSHAHMDHLHPRSLRSLRPGAAVVAPDDSGRLFRRAGTGDVTEVTVGDRLEVGPLTVEAVPAEHRAGRGPHSRVASAPLGFVVTAGGQRIYFAGDTDVFDGMADLGPVDIALVPIWGWGSTLGPGHLDPERAVAATALIQPRLVVPVHWGTYTPEDGRRRPPAWLDRPAEEFASALEDAGEGHRLRLLEPGDSLSLTG